MWINEVDEDNEPTFPEIAIPRPCVLVVQSDVLARHIVTSRLKRDGYLVYEAASGAEVLSMLRFMERFGWQNVRFELAILDHHLPDTTGMALIRRLRSEGNLLPALLMASHLDAELVREAAGCHVPILAKPLDLDRLCDVTIGEILTRKAPPQDARPGQRSNRNRHSPRPANTAANPSSAPIDGAMSATEVPWRTSTS